MVNWITPFIAVVIFLSGCASSGRPTPSAIYRHPVTGEVQWCEKPSTAMMALGGALVAAAQSSDYAGCKTGWEEKGYVRLPAGTPLPPADQQRYEAELEAMQKATADSIRKN